MGKPDHDVFISYRRHGGSELAQIVWNELVRRGYGAFVDVRDLRSGPFDGALEAKVDGCTDFVVLLTPGSLETVSDPDDWFHREIALALANESCNVIPIEAEIHGQPFEMPSVESLPEDLKDLPRQQRVLYRHDYSEESIERLCKMLTPRRWQKLVPFLLGATGLLVAVIAIWLTISSWTSSGVNDTAGNQPKAQIPVLPAILNNVPAAAPLQLIYASPPEAVTRLPTPISLNVEVLAKRKDQDKFESLSDGDKLASGVDDYFLVVRSSAPGYLYVFQVDSTGNTQWLFPKNSSCEYSNGQQPIGADEIVQVPSSEALFLDDAEGIEHLYCIFSATRWPELESQLTQSADQVASNTKIDQPFRISLRAAGGTRPRLSDAATDTLEISRVNNGNTHVLQVAVSAIEGIESRVVVERWFRHVENTPPLTSGN